MAIWKSKILVIPVLTIACLLVGYFLLLGNYRQLSAARAQLVNVQREHAALSDSLQQAESFLAEYDSLSAEARVATLALPLSPNPAYLLDELDQLSGQSGVAISSLNFLDTQTNDAEAAPEHTIVPLDVALSVSGSYLAFRDFLGRLEKHIRIINVQLMSIVVEEENSNYLFELRFQTYYQQ